MESSAIIVLVLCVLAAPAAFCWEMTWMNTSPLVGVDGVTPLGPGWQVQLIADGGDGVIADPFSLLTDLSLFAEWYNAGCPQIGPDFHPELGDDFLVQSSDAPNPTYIRD